MEKFFIKLSLFFAILSVIIYVINERYIIVRNTSSTDKFKNVPEKIQICNFGSSHGANGYHYDDLANDYTCFNFAMASQSLDYDWRIMQCYQDKIDDNAVVFITISYFSFYGIDETKTNNFLSKNKRYYRFLPKEFIKEYDLKTDIFENKLPALTTYENLLIDLLRGTKDEDIMEDEESINMEIYTKAAYKRHFVNEKLDKNGERIQNQEHVDSLYNMIELCKKKGVSVILVTTPYLKEYTDIVIENDPEFFDDFYGIIDQVVLDTNVRYYDFSRDDRFQKDYGSFVNADHLNHEGAIKFVNILMEEIGELLITMQ